MSGATAVIDLTVKWNGQTFSVPFAASGTLSELKQQLNQLTNVPLPRMKLLGIKKNTESATAGEMGLKGGSKITMMGTTDDVLRTLEEQKTEIEHERAENPAGFPGSEVEGDNGTLDITPPPYQGPLDEEIRSVERRAAERRAHAMEQLRLRQAELAARRREEIRQAQNIQQQQQTQQHTQQQQQQQQQYQQMDVEPGSVAERTFEPFSMFELNRRGRGNPFLAPAAPAAMHAPAEAMARPGSSDDEDAEEQMRLYNDAARHSEFQPRARTSQGSLRYEDLLQLVAGPIINLSQLPAEAQGSLLGVPLDCSFETAVRRAKDEFKILLTFFTRSPLTDVLWHALSNEAVAAFVAENMLLWGADVSAVDVAELQQRLGWESPDASGLIVAFGNIGQFSVIERIENTGEPDVVLVKLIDLVTNFSPMLEQARAVRVSSDTTEMLRMQQNEDLATAEERDRAIQDEIMRLEALEEEQRQRARDAEARREQVLLRRREHREKLAQHFASTAEPAAGAGIAMVSFRMPDGSLLKRRFGGAQLLSEVLLFAESRLAPEYSERVDLFTNFPRRALPDHTLSLETLGFLPSMALVVEAKKDNGIETTE